MTASAAASDPSGPRVSSRRRRIAWSTVLAIVVLVIVFLIVAMLSADFLWFQQLGFTRVLTTEWGGRIGMFAAGFLGMGVPAWASIAIAYRARPVYAQLGAPIDRAQEAVEPLRRVATWLVPAILGLCAGLAVSGQWTAVALFLNGTPFGQTDPQFGLDFSFYFFALPFWRGLVGFALWAVGLAVVIAFVTVWLYGGFRVVGRQLRISRPARIQLAITLGIWLLLQSANIWLEQYALLAEPSVGTLQTGAGFTEVNAIIPGKEILAGAAIVVAVLCFVTAVVGRWRFPVVGLASLLVLAIVLGGIYPWIVQRFRVEPSAQNVEAPYLQRNIDATRTAFGVNDVDVVNYSATTDAEPGALRQDAATTASIRIIDPAIVPSVFRQLQQFKQYYSFSDIDVDRYTIDGKVQDTVIAARDLNLQGLGDSQSWYNNTIVYTHGYGVVAAYGNDREADGEPKFLESGIPSTGSLGDYEPRIYFGEDSPDYSIVGAPSGTAPVELDYPSGGSDSAAPMKTTFDGDGGPKLDSLFARLVYAVKFGSSEILFSNAVNQDSQILYDRDPVTRIQQVAPYLTLDGDPYPAIVDGRIEWIVDGYTTGTAYPYSSTVDMTQAVQDADTGASSAFVHDDVNYIRNSVKATVDAYDGKVTLYAWDPTDPVLQTWEKVFPGTVQPASTMSAELLQHVRYPEDLFKVQRQVLGSYHVTDPGSFYSGDDRWVTPDDPVASTSGLQPPYYLTMQVPGTEAPGYTLYSTYIPASTTNSRQVLSGYLAADGDAGPDYGKLTLLTLPTQSIAAPAQVFTQFKTDSSVSNDVLSLTAGGGNQIVYGNLLTLPVGGGLLYVQPVYVQASSGTTFPLLRKVMVSFGNSIAFEDTLDEALDQLFGGDSGASAGDQGEGGGSATPPPTGGGGGTGAPTGTPTDAPTTPPTDSSIKDPAALKQALADYQQALSDRNAAYAKGDLVAAAQAEQQMQDAIQKALDAAG